MKAGMSSPPISVAMSVYNGERFLDEAIASVRAQSFADFEFLILDDGSNDGSRAIIERHAAQDRRIRPIIRENRGLIASLNRMLDEARGPLIARMDADDVCLPHRFERQIAFLAAHPDYAVVGSAALDIDEHGAPFPAPDHPPPEWHEDVLKYIEVRTPLCHPAVMARRDVLLNAGGYHRAYRHCEDYDLWLRIASRARIGNLAEPLLKYRRYAEQISSRHAVEQTIGAAIAVSAYHERLAGRPDPTEHLDRLPPIDELDTLFGRSGIAQAVRARVANGLLYSPVALRGEGFDLLLRHVGDGGRGEALWRTVPRLVRLGEPRRAVRLAAALARA